MTRPDPFSHDFFEEDEPLEDVLEAMARGEEVVTVRPLGGSLRFESNALGTDLFEAWQPNRTYAIPVRGERVVVSSS